MDDLMSPPVSDRGVPMASTVIPADTQPDPVIRPVTHETAPISTNSENMRQDSDQGDDDNFNFCTQVDLTSLLKLIEKTLPALFAESGDGIDGETPSNATLRAVMSSLLPMSSLEFEEFLIALREAGSECPTEGEEVASFKDFSREDSHILPPRNEFEVQIHDARQIQRRMNLDDSTLCKWPKGSPPSILHLELESRLGWVSLRGVHALSLLRRAEYYDRPELLDEANDVFTDAMKCLPEGCRSSLLLSVSTSLAIALDSRFNRLGNIDDLQQAISLSQLNVDLARGGGLNEPLTLGKLSSLLAKRSNRFGDLDDIDRAISLGCRAVELTPDNEPIKPVQLSNLGNALILRFGRLGELEDLDQATVIQRCSVELTPDDHPKKPSRLSTLGAALQARFHRLGNLEDLRKATVVKHRAVELTPDNHPDKSGLLTNLGNALEACFDRLQSFPKTLRHLAKSVVSSTCL